MRSHSERTPPPPRAPGQPRRRRPPGRAPCRVRRPRGRPGGREADHQRHPSSGEPGPADPASPVAFDLVLAERDPVGAARFRAAVADPSSPSYRAYLTAAEIGERFGPTDATLARIRATLDDAGLSVVSMPPQRTRLSVRGSAAAVGRFLGVAIERWQHPGSEGTYAATSGSPVVPASLQDAVIAVNGLSPWLPVSAIDPADAPPVPARGLTPADLALAYDFQSLWDQGIDGTGVNVGILQFGVDTDEDLAVFDAAFGVDGPTPIRVPINGGLVDAPADFATEAALDTRVLRAVAPGAQDHRLWLPAATSFGAAMDAIVEDGRTQIVSVSYGKCYSGASSRSTRSSAPSGRSRPPRTRASRCSPRPVTGAPSRATLDNTDHRVATFFPACTNNVVSVGARCSSSTRTARTSARRDGRTT
ncbi:MAG: protease pro-enzyme activation domain-containing protein [Chloroflexota bacterium]